MNHQTMARTRLGRIALHLLALNRDWKFRWHLAGVWREIA
jgi:hypothetical protein